MLGAGIRVRDLWLLVQLAAVGLDPRKGSNPTKRLYIFEIVATLVFSNKKGLRSRGTSDSCYPTSQAFEF
jgi:hypothetical protein